jgi:hypothetical protein
VHFLTLLVSSEYKYLACAFWPFPALLAPGYDGDDVKVRLSGSLFDLRCFSTEGMNGGESTQPAVSMIDVIPRKALSRIPFTKLFSFRGPRDSSGP